MATTRVILRAEWDNGRTEEMPANVTGGSPSRRNAQGRGAQAVEARREPLTETRSAIERSVARAEGRPAPVQTRALVPVRTSILPGDLVQSDGSCCDDLPCSYGGKAGRVVGPVVVDPAGRLAVRLDDHYRITHPLSALRRIA